MTNLTNALTLDEVCERGKITKSGFRTLKQQGRTPPGYKVGRRVYFLPADVERWLAGRIVKIDGAA